MNKAKKVLYIFSFTAVIGYVIFRGSNSQKDRFRACPLSEEFKGESCNVNLTYIMLDFFYRLDIISSPGAFEGDHLHNGGFCIFCLTTSCRRGQQLVYEILRQKNLNGGIYRRARKRKGKLILL